ncbi:MAG: type III secretion system chaperone [Pseudomonadota bacterium]
MTFRFMPSTLPAAIFPIALASTLIIPSPLAATAAQDAPLVPAPRPPAEGTVTAKAPTTVTDLITIARELDPNVERDGNGATFTVAGRELTLIADPTANRMRLISPIGRADDLPDDAARRLLEANFSTALDARYAISGGVIWSAFIHPLATLDEEEFLSGIAQTVNAADNFGTSFSSGGMQFGAGDGANTGEAEPEELMQPATATTDI